MHHVEHLVQGLQVGPHLPCLPQVKTLPPGVAAEEALKLDQLRMHIVRLAHQLVDNDAAGTGAVVLDHPPPLPGFLPHQCQCRLLGCSEGGEAMSGGRRAHADHGDADADDRAHEGADRGTLQDDVREAGAEVRGVVGIDEAHGEVSLPRHSEHAETCWPTQHHLQCNEHNKVHHAEPPSVRVELRRTFGIDPKAEQTVQSWQESAGKVVPCETQSCPDVHVDGEADDHHGIREAEAILVQPVQRRDIVWQRTTTAREGSAKRHVSPVSESWIGCRTQNVSLQPTHGEFWLLDVASVVFLNVAPAVFVCPQEDANRNVDKCR
mmetsp:Transcript_48918/g.141705  ORF Transcript_48918/g.141705 Transcript_48918/m.141705 type:complete len:322 (-) Transcript_48918:464-1429(-)